MKQALFISLLLNFLLLACAAAPKEYISTWLLGPDGLTHKTATAREAKTWAESQGFRCYSRDDDLIWRQRMAICCGESGL